MLKVLVIDDHAGFRNLVRRQLLERWPDARVKDCDPCTEGLAPAAWTDTDHDIVLLDYQLGPQNGFDYLRRFRAMPNFPPVIMLTGEGNERLAVEAIKLGAADYIPKQAMTLEVLTNAIQEALDARGTVERFEKAGALHQTGERYVEIGGLTIVRKIAEGGMSTVYLARRNRSGEDVVLKVFDQSRAEQRDAAALQRFEREYEILRKLDHPGIVRIYEQGFTDAFVYIAMEYFPRGSLRERLQPDMAPADAVRYVSAIADALEVVHGAGVVHRDLKPGNVMFRDDGTAVLIDFGLAKRNQEAMDITRAGLLVGTPHYISPEQVDGLPADARSDLYALGVMFFELLSGTVPYTARTPLAVLYKHRHAPIPLLAASQAPFQPLIERLMAKNPDRRCASVAEFRQGLAQLRTADAGRPAS